MTIEADIKTTLDAHGGLSALVGSRSYASHLPPSPTYPNVVFFRISSEPVNHLTGRSVRHNAMFQFDVRHNSSYATMRSVVKQLISAMESATLFKAVLQDDNDAPLEANTETYRAVVDFSVWFEDN